MDTLGYLGIAFSLVWLGIGFYLFRLTARLKRVERSIEERERRRS